MVEFEKVSQAHIPLLFSWLNSPHLKELYDEGYASYQQLEEKYFANRKNVTRYIAKKDDQPFGYIQRYDIDALHDYHCRAHSSGDTIGIDLFIGEPAFLGQGYGYGMVSSFIASLGPNIEKIIVDPQTHNSAAIGLFQKYGFKEIQEAQGNMMMEIEIRRAVRALLFNHEKKLLLIQMDGKASRDLRYKGKYFWLTPGGKIEKHETELEALKREIREEVGFDDVRIEKKVFSQERLGVWNNIPIRLFDAYYLAFVTNDQVSFDFQMEDEKESILGYKWWNIEDLALSKELMFPKDLVRQLFSYAIQNF